MFSSCSHCMCPSCGSWKWHCTVYHRIGILQLPWLFQSPRVRFSYLKILNLKTHHTQERALLFELSSKKKKPNWFRAVQCFRMYHQFYNKLSNRFWVVVCFFLSISFPFIVFVVAVAYYCFLLFFVPYIERNKDKSTHDAHMIIYTFQRPHLARRIYVSITVVTVNVAIIWIAGILSWMATWSNDFCVYLGVILKEFFSTNTQLVSRPTKMLMANNIFISFFLSFAICMPRSLSSIASHFLKRTWEQFTLLPLSIDDDNSYAQKVHGFHYWIWKKWFDCTV